jgi:antitoxin component YwqK of YwqJK toxin-antitoxin module
MKNLMILIGMVLIIQACGGSAENNATAAAPTVEGVNTEGMELIDVSGGYQRAIRKNAEGKILEEGMLRNGKRNGTWVVYNLEKGFPSSVANFVDDMYSGPYLKYNNFGQLELSCGYTDNQLDGYFVKFERTKKLEEGYYKNGQYEGEYTKYFTGKDVPQQQLQYKNGQLHGKAKYFNEAGELLMEYEYKNGEKVSGGIVQNQAEK